MVMWSPCAGSALDPPLWIVPDKTLSFSLSLSPNKGLALLLLLFLLFFLLLEAGYCVFLFLLLQYLLQSCSRGGRGIVKDMCYERRRAEACVD
jgi:hypothetical protein